MKAIKGAAWIKRSKERDPGLMHECNQENHPTITTTKVMIGGNENLAENMRSFHVDLRNHDLYMSVGFFPEYMLKDMTDMNFTSFRADGTVYAQTTALKEACQKHGLNNHVNNINDIEKRILTDQSFMHLFKKLSNELSAEDNGAESKQ